MPSKLSIINRAIVELGEELALSEDDATEQAEKANEIFDEVLEEVLAEHPWKFAIKRVQLMPQDEDPAYGEYHIFQVPGDCVTALKNNPKDLDESEFLIEADKILVSKDSYYNEDSGVKFNFRYISSIMKYGVMPQSFAKAVSLGIAESLAYDFTGSASASGNMTQKYQMAIRRAKSHQSKMASGDTVKNDDIYLQARQ